jgi:hypothetical protein
MSKTSTLNPAGMSIIFGDIIIGGFPKGDYLAITYNEDGFAEIVGVDGEHTRVMLSDNSAIAVVTVQQSSLTNTKLSNKYNSDRRNGNSRGDFSVKDPRGDTDLKGSGAYIKKMADASWANDIKMNAWSIYIPDLSGVLGGNPDE